MDERSMVGIGEPAPWFSAAIDVEARQLTAFDELAGRYIVLCFLDALPRAAVADVLEEVARREQMFDGTKALFVGLSGQREDLSRSPLVLSAGRRFLWDATGAAAQKYGVSDSQATSAATPLGRAVFLLSPALQIIEMTSVHDATTFATWLDRTLASRIAHPSHPESAPVLVVPHIFDRDFCNRLIELYDAGEARELGVVETAGVVAERFDPRFRKRLDHYISDDVALQRSREMLVRRLLPMIYRAFQFRVSRIERYLVGCYDAETGGYFRPHRDNTAPVVAHRRFAVTINLNDGYEGGELVFPEYGHTTYRGAVGAAIVFSCALLHEVRPVTRNRRYAFLTFLYDEASQKIREDHMRTMGGARTTGDR